MQALPETSQHERAGRGPKASPSRARSSLAAFDAHQRGRASYRALSRGHGAHVVVRMDHEATEYRVSHVTAVRSVAIADLPVNCRGFGSGLFPHSHRLPASPLRSSRSGSVCSLAQTRTYSANLAGANRLCVRNTLPHQQIPNALADVAHSDHRLSCVARLVGIDPNENGLTHAQASFAPGANSND